MEQYEATLGADEHLHAVVSERRRQSSISEDYSVQKTNDDATESKFAVVQLGCYQDPFISCFVSMTQVDYSNGTELPPHRDPEILRGYWARVVSIQAIVQRFLEITGEEAQIVNLGAGFDTLFWRLKAAGAKFSRFVDIDFGSVTAKKIHQIRRRKRPVDLELFFSEPVAESQHCDLHAGNYQLLAADLRQVHEFVKKLANAELDPAKPTLFLAECVFVYMEAEKSEQLLTAITSSFSTAFFVNYEQVNTGDQFTRIMSENLSRRGILMPGLEASETLEKQKQRFERAGFTTVSGWTMNDVYNSLNPEEVSRVERLTPLDEKELLVQLLQHYSLCYAFKGANDELASLDLEAINSGNSTFAGAAEKMEQG